MAELAAVRMEDGVTIYVETTESALLPGQSRISPATAAKDAAERAVKTGEQMIESVTSLCTRVLTSLRELEPEDRPANAELEFSLSISLEGNVYVVKGSGQGSITIRAQWDLGGGNEQPH